MDGLALLLGIVSIPVVGIAAFMRHDGYPGHLAVGKAAEVAGYAGAGIALWLRGQAEIERGTDCSVFNRDCERYEDVGRYLWDLFLEPFFGWEALVGLALAGGAHLVGRLVAQATRRRPDHPGEPDRGHVPFRP